MSVAGSPAAAARGSGTRTWRPLLAGALISVTTTVAASPSPTAASSAVSRQARCARAEALQPGAGGVGGGSAAESVDGAEVGEVAEGGEGKRRGETLRYVRRARAARDPALRRRVQAGEEAEEGGLPGAVRSFYTGEGAGAEGEVDAP